MSCTVAGLSMRSPCWSTDRRRPRPTSCRREMVLSLFLSMHMTNTFGLSQPSRSAECEKMKRTGSVEGQQPLLVLQDQVVGIDVVGLAGVRRRASAIVGSTRRLVFLSIEK